MLYQIREWQRAILKPLSNVAHHFAQLTSNPLNPWAYTGAGQYAYAGFELFHRVGKEYEKPAFGITDVEVKGKTIAVSERTVFSHAFCNLLEFVRDVPASVAQNSPTVLVCAPLSGHHSTLLRDTVHSLLQDHNVFITDWIDARMVPLHQGSFDLSDYVNYIQDFIRLLGNKVHLLSVCQPTVPVLAAVSLMASNGETLPLSMTMMGGPIDARQSPTGVNDLATERPLSWFQTNVIYTVPAKYPGYMRHVYPGFLQHAGFIAMNPSRHADSHWDYYSNLLKGDDEDAEHHRKFYDEYNAVLDLPAEFYLDTIKIVFQEHALPRGTWYVNDQRVAPEDIKGTGLLTIEGELDDISGSGQTKAALNLCKSIPETEKKHYIVKGAGHYGIFSGRRWREHVYPEVRNFIASFHKKSIIKPIVSNEFSLPKNSAIKTKVRSPQATLKTPILKPVIKIATKTKAKPTQTIKTSPNTTKHTVKGVKNSTVMAKKTSTAVTGTTKRIATKITVAPSLVKKTSASTTADNHSEIDHSTIMNIKKNTVIKKK